ncbi:hypothetical protein BKA62DRAFT_742778 [Auriculariales sp. MPI-PUGE-AT-0066]|nr:hypothetical protein BKA62DRAFT_742778 [Auriculariales sp. MPI-PUGE-AT-0066]
MMDEDDSHRPNALFVSGKPIANLPTQRIFAYAAHFDVVPLGLEWVDDTSCVLLFKSRAGARQALESLAKNADEDRLDGSREARSVPLSLWPMESRIHSVLGKSAGGADEPLRIRWAEISDVKKRGAHRASQFYKKHGETAGREVYVDGVLVLPPPRTDSEATSARPAQRRRIDSDTQRAELDAELDAFLNGEDTGKEPFRDRDHDRSSRSGRTQVPIRRSSRSASPARRDGGDRNGRGRPRREERSERRPHKTQEQLDAELEEFLAGRA